MFSSPAMTADMAFVSMLNSSTICMLGFESIALAYLLSAVLMIVCSILKNFSTTEITLVAAGEWYHIGYHMTAAVAFMPILNCPLP